MALEEKGRVMCILVFTVVVAVLAVSAHAADYETITKPYHDALRHRCPEKHLDLLSPADLNDVIESLRDSLPPARRGRLDRTADMKRACAHTIAGIGCMNTAYIHAATRLELLPEFAKMVCGLPIACTAQSDCAKQP